MLKVLTALQRRGPLAGRFRRAFSLVEVMISVVVIAIALTAILMVAAASTNMMATAKEDIDMRKMVANWYEIMEGYDRLSLANSTSFDVVVGEAAHALDGNASGSGATYTIEKFIFDASKTINSDGTIQLNLSVQTPMFAGSGKKFEYSRIMNSWSSQAVDNGRLWEWFTK